MRQGSFVHGLEYGFFNGEVRKVGCCDQCLMLLNRSGDDVHVCFEAAHILLYLSYVQV